MSKYSSESVNNEESKVMLPLFRFFMQERPNL